MCCDFLLWIMLLALCLKTFQQTLEFKGFSLMFSPKSCIFYSRRYGLFWINFYIMCKFPVFSSVMQSFSLHLISYSLYCYSFYVAPFVEKATLPPLNWFYTFVENQFIIVVWVCFQVLYFFHWCLWLSLHQHNTVLITVSIQ